MIVALYIFLALVAVGVVLKITDCPRFESLPESTPEPPEACCGTHLVCERAAEAATSDEIEYFDDEELDAFAGRHEAAYTPAETEQFRDVMLTLPPGEAAPWARSLSRRGIALPSSLRDELLILLDTTA